MRTLIVAPNWIGDAVMAQPLLAMLRAADPEGRIEVLAPPHVAPVFEAMTETDAVLEARNEHGKPQLRERWRLAHDLRRRAYDRCHVLPNSLKSALVPFLAGIPERIGRRGEARYGLINRMHDDRGAQRPPMVEFYAQLALPPGRTAPTPVSDPVLHSDPARQAKARSRVGIDERAALIVLCPGAEYGPAKRWPTAHFATLAQLLARRRPGCTLAIIGSAKERALATEIATLADVPMLNLCGETSLGEAV
ncbi:MAG: lipopolysaccharide heptosyltransferase, partial [Pseudomonadota bacterium]